MINHTKFGIDRPMEYKVTEGQILACSIRMACRLKRQVACHANPLCVIALLCVISCVWLSMRVIVDVKQTHDCRSPVNSRGTHEHVT